MAKTFKEVCKLFESVENTASRLDMTSLMGEFLKQCNIGEIQMISYLVQGRVAPKFVDSEFNYSEKSLINLLTEYFKDEKIDVNGVRQGTGDIGDMVFEFSDKLKKRAKSRSVEKVYKLLWDIVNTSGLGSVERKGNLVINFLNSTSDIEAKYFIRIVCGSLRLGLHSKTMMDVFSYIITNDKELSNEFDRVYGVSSDIGFVASFLDDFNRESVLKGMGKVTITPGFPVLARLVERVGSFDEAVKRVGDKFLVQGKFDGLRLQIHKYSKKEIINRDVIWRDYLTDNSQGLNLFGSIKQEDTVIKLFTRNLEDVTNMFPEVVGDAQNISAKSFIADSEVLGWDYEKDTFLSYQTTMQRRRKYEIEKVRETIPVKAILFDLLYLEGKDLTEADTVDRIEVLEEIFEGVDNSLRVADTTEISSATELQDIFDEYVDKGLEGVIVKQLKGGYSAGKRNFEWIKLKKSMDSGLVDTVDLVVVGYFYGSGRRAELGIGALLGALYNEKESRYDAICKVGTGISDELFKEIVEELKSIEVLKKTKDVAIIDGLEPDVWVKPKFVITVDADEVTRDIGKDKKGVGSGLSLRFPRLIEWDREKGLENITTVSELATIFGAKNK